MGKNWIKTQCVAEKPLGKNTVILYENTVIPEKNAIFRVSPYFDRPPHKNLRASLKSEIIMENVEDKVLSQSVAEFHLQCSVSQNLGVAPCAYPQNTLIAHAIHVCQYRQVCDKWQGILGLYRICLGWLQLGHLLGLATLHRMRQGLCVLHRTWIANAKCGCWSLSATRSRLDHQFHCPCGTPKWVKTRLAASLRQGLIVILSAKSIHA